MSKLPRPNTGSWMRNIFCWYSCVRPRIYCNKSVFSVPKLIYWIVSQSTIIWLFFLLCRTTFKPMHFEWGYFSEYIYIYIYIYVYIYIYFWIYLFIIQGWRLTELPPPPAHALTKISSCASDEKFRGFMLLSAAHNVASLLVKLL